MQHHLLIIIQGGNGQPIRLATCTHLIYRETNQVIKNLISHKRSSSDVDCVPKESFLIIWAQRVSDNT